MNIVCLIPARGGSKGIPHKNIKKMGGQPLIAYPISIAKKSKYIDRVIVSTDSLEIKEIAEKYGAEVPFVRPDKYATDTATDLSVFKHFLKWMRENNEESIDLIVQLRTTEPLRTVEIIDSAIKKMLDNPKADSLRSVKKSYFSPYKMWEIDNYNNLKPLLCFEKEDWYDLPRQDLPMTYEQDGLIDIIRPETIEKYHSMSGENILSFTHNLDVVDIDDIESLYRAEKVLKDQYNSFKNKYELNNFKWGIIQGRLTPSKSNELQCFPYNQWKEEFLLAKKLHYSHIELIVDSFNNLENPLWSEIGTYEIKKIIKYTGIKVKVICLDIIIQNNIHLITEEIKKLIVRSATLKIEKIILPLFGESNINTENYKQLVETLTNISEICELYGIELLIESLLDWKYSIELLNEIKTENVKVCYDSGNLIPLNIDTYTEVSNLADVIGHVHIKDKNLDGENVTLGDGNTNFKALIKALNKINYKGEFTFETCRETDPEVTAINNIKFLQSCIDEFYEENKNVEK